MFIGISINVPNENDKNIINQDNLDDFEGNISNKDNDYTSSIIEIDPNLVNGAGKKVEDLIDTGFSFVFSIIKGFINDK